MASGRSCGGLGSGKGMSGGGYSQLEPQRGEFSTCVRGETMIRYRIIHPPKRRDSHASHGAGAEGGTKGFRDDPGEGPKCAARIST